MSQEETEIRSAPPPRGIVILGPTASGKTRLAARTAARLDGEIISADSRQVFRGMDLGTGKDLDDYDIDAYSVPFHLIDIRDPSDDYNLFEYQRDAREACRQILQRNRLPVLCGGTGLYLESVLGNYRLQEVPHDESLRRQLESQSDEELVARLCSMRPLHNQTDIRDRERLVRAIEIEFHQQAHREESPKEPALEWWVVGIHWERAHLRQRITARLQQRLKSGLVAEVEGLLQRGLPAEKLHYFGLEYRFVARHLEGELSQQEMFQQLNTAIHQFSKRQMTWFRRMERRGLHIHWLEGAQDPDENLDSILKLFRTS